MRQACVGRRCLKMESFVPALDADGNVLRMPPRMPSTEEEERVSAQQLAALHGFVCRLGGAADILDGWYAKTETRRQGTSAGSTDTCACPLLSRSPRARSPLSSPPSLPVAATFFTRRANGFDLGARLRAGSGWTPRHRRRSKRN